MIDDLKKVNDKFYIECANCGEKIEPQDSHFIEVCHYRDGLIVHLSYYCERYCATKDNLGE